MRCLSHSHQRPDDPTPDYWQVRGNDKCCSYCGSWHPDEFLEFLKEAADPSKPGCIDPATGKNYKVYIERPQVKNAMDGAIKFYKWHLPNEMSEEIQALYREAVEVSFRKTMRRLDEVCLEMGMENR